MTTGSQVIWQNTKYLFRTVAFSFPTYQSDGEQNRAKETHFPIESSFVILKKSQNNNLFSITRPIYLVSGRQIKSMQDRQINMRHNKVHQEESTQNVHILNAIHVNLRRYSKQRNPAYVTVEKNLLKTIYRQFGKYHLATSERATGTTRIDRFPTR